MEWYWIILLVVAALVIGGLICFTIVMRMAPAIGLTAILHELFGGYMDGKVGKTRSPREK